MLVYKHLLSFSEPYDTLDENECVAEEDPKSANSWLDQEPSF
jgi:hypothetical protein